MRSRSFTLIEVLIVIVIIGIVGTLGYPLYLNTKVEALDRVDAARLKALKASFDIYIMEHDAVPATITRIPVENIQNAYAKILESRGGWKIKLASWWLGLSEKGFAYATDDLSLLNDIAKGDRNLLCCPTSSTCQHAHAINQKVAGMTAAQYKTNFGADEYLFGDSYAGWATFTGSFTTYFHIHYGFFGTPFGGYSYGVGITKGGVVKRAGYGVPSTRVVID